MYTKLFFFITIPGAASNHKQRVSNVHRKIHSIITDRLSTFFLKLFSFDISNVIAGELINDPKGKMHWTHYWQDVVTCHHVIIDGWPKDMPFKNLSNGLSSLPAL